MPPTLPEPQVDLPAVYGQAIDTKPPRCATGTDRVSALVTTLVSLSSVPANPSRTVSTSHWPAPRKASGDWNVFAASAEIPPMYQLAPLRRATYASCPG